MSTLLTLFHRPDSGGDRNALYVAAYDSSVADKAQAQYICDGADDQVEINTALGKGNQIILLGGNYSINAPILIASSKDIGGSGEVILKLADNADCILMRNDDQTNGNASISIHNMTLDGNRANQSAGLPDYASSCLTLKYARGLLLHDLVIRDALDYCAQLYRSSDIVVRSVNCNVAGRDVWTIDECVDGVFTSVIGNSGTADRHAACNGFEIENGSHRLIFDGVVANGNVANGVKTQTHSAEVLNTEISLSNVTAIGNGGMGLDFQSCTDSSVDGFVVNSNGSRDIYLTTLTDCWIRNITLDSPIGLVIQFFSQITRFEMSDSTLNCSGSALYFSAGTFEDITFTNVNIEARNGRAIQFVAKANINGFAWVSGTIHDGVLSAPNLAHFPTGTYANMSFANCTLSSDHPTGGDDCLVYLAKGVDNFMFSGVAFDYDDTPSNGAVYQVGDNENIIFVNCTGL